MTKAIHPELAKMEKGNILKSPIDIKGFVLSQSNQGVANVIEAFDSERQCNNDYYINLFITFLIIIIVITVLYYVFYKKQ